MSEITLEKVDQVKERAFVTYAEAKEALEYAKGDVLEALIYIEEKQKFEHEAKIAESQTNSNNANSESVAELKEWLVDIIKKGNVSRVKVKKDNRVLVDIPVNAGIAAGAIAILIPQLLAIGVITAVATNLVIEITKTDGSVEVVNKIVKKAAKDFGAKAKDVAEEVKDMAQEKVQEVKEVIDENKHSRPNSTEKTYKVENEVNYTYTVNFDENSDN